MKIGALFGWFVPELRKMNGSQLLKVWGGCTPYSRNAIYFHCILLLACCSVIFNLSMLPYPLWFKIVMPTAVVVAIAYGCISSTRRKPAAASPVAP